MKLVAAASAEKRPQVVGTLRGRASAGLLPVVLYGIFLVFPVEHVSAKPSVPSAPTVRPPGQSGFTVGSPYLSMPRDETTSLPAHLSETGAFTDVKNLIPAPDLMPYEINAPFWSDGAAKRRWISVPSTADKSPPIAFHETNPFTFPAGTVFVKHFEMPVDITKTSATSVRIETRILVRDCHGGVYGATYKWRTDNSDADLVAETLRADIPAAQGQSQSSAAPRPWFYPAPTDCRTCHTALTGGVLGVNARQLNRTPASSGENQLVAWSRMGLLSTGVPSSQVNRIPRLSPPDDETAPLEQRVRSYLDVNCAMCHQPGGVTGHFDARFATEMANQQLVGGHVQIDMGLDKARVIAPNDPWRSILLQRISTVEQGIKMPPLGHEVVDAGGVNLVRNWIVSLPGSPVLPPPIIEPAAGNFNSTVTVVLSHPDPGATIHYTLDGSSPGDKAPVYVSPVELAGPTTIRARATKDGYTRSIPAQQTYVIRP